MSKISGVYKILNKIDGKIYIGSANDIDKRWYGHKRKLNKGIHENKYLQQAWNEYNAENFTFEIIEKVENLNDLIDVEQKWIDNSKCINRDIGYNIKEKAGNGVKKEINIEDLRLRDIKKTKEIFDEDKIKPNYKPFEISLIKAGKSRQDLKDDLNISGATLAKINKREYISLKTVAQICEYLDVQIQDIVIFGNDIF